MKFSIRRINEWLILFMIVVLVTVGFSFIQDDWKLIPNEINYLFNIHPSTLIISLATIDAIDVFSGERAKGFSITWRAASIYFNVLIYLMLGPYLFFKGFKKAKSNQDNAKPWYWYIGGAICIGSFMIIPVEIRHLHSYYSEVYNSNMENVDKSRESDLMRTELAEVGFAAAQHEILEDGVNESFEIEDLNLHDLKYDHSVVSIESDTLLVISVSNPEQPDLGHVMEVRPYSESVLRIRN
ncbi:MAG: hypothetical protein U5K71_11765 [Gracilimonas sp.]|nr:hypothetical protein [Gracilimonas sp.]